MTETQKRRMARLRIELEQVRVQYYELLYEVATKHPGETRHETARRYIRQAEQRPSQAASAEARPDR